MKSPIEGSPPSLSEDIGRVGTRYCKPEEEVEADAGSGMQVGQAASAPRQEGPLANDAAALSLLRRCGAGGRIGRDHRLLPTLAITYQAGEQPTTASAHHDHHSQPLRVR